MNYKKRAVQALAHYLRYGVRANGGNWDYDNDSEVETIVDDIANAVATEMKTELDQLRAEIQQLRDDIRSIGNHPSLI